MTKMTVTARPTDQRWRIGIDLGGTKIEAIVLDARGQVCWQRRVATPQGDYPGTVAAIVALVQAAEQTLDVTASVGVGIPGAISALTGRVKNANSVCLNGQPLAADLSAALVREVRLANDANCFAMSEAVDGAGADAQTVMGVILGTGVGAGIVFDRQLIVGCNAIAGEWGHMPLPSIYQRGTLSDPVRQQTASTEMPGPPCYCGRFGCVETWLSGPGFAADHARVVRSDPRAQLDAPAIIRAMACGDAQARQSFDRYVDRLARSLASVINIIDPHVVVLGGGLSQIDELYAALPAQLAPYVFSDQVQTRVVKNRHGDASGVRGAAWLWPRSAEA